jgi:hypothetical protein
MVSITNIYNVTYVYVPNDLFQVTINFFGSNRFPNKYFKQKLIPRNKNIILIEQCKVKMRFQGENKIIIL